MYTDDEMVMQRDVRSGIFAVFLFPVELLKYRIKNKKGVTLDNLLGLFLPK